ncbi:hypothetical protein BT67DRAFT_444593, partial [Trichocladium antarcticum]
KRNRIFARYKSGVLASEVTKKEGVSKAYVCSVVKRCRRLTKLNNRDKRRILHKILGDLLYYRYNLTISL